MLTGYQCETVAYIGDGFVVCRECAVKQSSELSIEKADRGLVNTSGLDPISRFSAEEEWSFEGLYCEDCGTEIVEPSIEEEEESDEDDPRPKCSECGGPGNPLGTLGHLGWHRCENCGIDFSTIA